MKNEPFLESFREINHRFIDLIDVLSALSGLSMIGSEPVSEQQLLKSALVTLIENVDLERCSVFILENNELHCQAGLDWLDINTNEKDIKRHKHTSMVFKIGEGAIGKAVQYDKAVVINDCASDERVIYGIDKNGNKQSLTGSLISVPIHFKRNILGVLNASHPDIDHFNDTHERLLSLFANFLGQILANWRHVNIMEELVQQQTSCLERALSESEKLKDRYKELSVVDELTGLHNRRFFFPEAEAALTRAMRYKQSFSIMVIDVDHFKEVNDSYGHMAGDFVLENLSLLLAKEVRDADILCRFGGEEFMIAMPNTDILEAQILAERIQKNIRDTKWHNEGRTMRITMTSGITDIESIRDLIDTQNKTELLLEELIKQADRAMYFGKENGRNQIRVFKDIICKIE
ncbi:MAG: sensor domain-containing diguanylate cyclase [Gammaproteobacteria bacterium]|nr:sensor domain-containing diguanylate cyclase [Gammaproteobacteria bacterium]